MKDEDFVSLHSRILEFAEHLEELGALWLCIKHSWMVNGRHRKNARTGQPHQWHEHFWMQGCSPNQVRKALNRFLETNQLDVLATVYDDQAQLPVDQITPVLAGLQAEIYNCLEHDCSYSKLELAGLYVNAKLPEHWKSSPMQLRCTALFLKHYDQNTKVEKRRSMLKKIAGRLQSTDTTRVNAMRQTYKALGGDPAELEFWDEHLSKYHKQRN